MHIPDGFLSTPVWAALDAVSLPAIGLLSRRASREIDDLRIPLLGVMGAFVFAAQMINFPVGLGTSGHLVGGALLAITLGPGAAALVMTAILAIQAFVFQDGGILVLGANVFNMAIAGVFAGYLPYQALSGTRHRAAGIFLGGFISVLASAVLALSELLVSGVRMPGPILAVSGGLFVVSAALEGLITLAVVRSIERLHPAWVRDPVATGSRAFQALALGAVFLAAVGILAASQAPDGLESFAEKIGLSEKAKALLSTPLADYQTPLGPAWVSRAAAGLAGVALIWLLCLAIGRLVTRRRTA